MRLPYTFESRRNVNIVIDRLYERINENGSLSINSIHETVDKLFWLQKYYCEPPKACYVDECCGWWKENFIVDIVCYRDRSGAIYMINLNDPIGFK